MFLILLSLVLVTRKFRLLREHHLTSKSLPKSTALSRLSKRKNEKWRNFLAPRSRETVGALYLSHRMLERATSNFGTGAKQRARRSSPVSISHRSSSSSRKRARHARQRSCFLKRPTFCTSAFSNRSATISLRTKNTSK